MLRVDGKKVTPVGEVEVGGLPEGARVHTGRTDLLVGNYLDQDISILKVDGTRDHRTPANASSCPATQLRLA